MTDKAKQKQAVSQEWIEDCLKWRGRILRGPDAHWCDSWDGLPVSAFTPEYSCCEESKTILGRFCNWLYMLWFNWRFPSGEGD